MLQLCTLTVQVCVHGKTLLSGALPKRVKGDESYWTLDDAGTVHAPQPVPMCFLQD